MLNSFVSWLAQRLQVVATGGALLPFRCYLQNIKIYFIAPFRSPKYTTLYKEFFSRQGLGRRNELSIINSNTTINSITLA